LSISQQLAIPIAQQLAPPSLWEVQLPSILSAWQSRDLDWFIVWLFSRTSQVFSKTSILFVTPQTLRTKTSINICDQICEKGPYPTFEMYVLQSSKFQQSYAQ